MPIEISGRSAEAVKLRIRTLRQQLKSDVLVLDAAYLHDQTIYKNAAKTGCGVVSTRGTPSQRERRGGS